MKSIFKKSLPHIIAIFAFLIVSSVYFYPAWQGKSLQGEDSVGHIGAAREKNDYKYFEDKDCIWNGGIFSGMPDLIGAKFKGASNLHTIYALPMKAGIPREVASILWYMLGFYILLITLGIKPYISAGGAIVFSLSTYYIIIILAGHFMKVDTLAMIPPTLAGVLLCYRKKYLWGFILTAFFLAIQINMAHMQMMYYFMLSLIILAIVEFCFHLKEKKLKDFFIASAILVFAAFVGIAANSAKLVTFYTYNDYSIRGESELTLGQPSDIKETKGLDKDYINAWSSGVDESMMVIVPNVKGGATAVIGARNPQIDNVPKQYRQTVANMNQYWGNQPFSGGPNYLGIVLVFLFVLGAFLIPGRLKYIALIPVILFFFLSMGGSIPAFTNLFIDYVPMYNKFRAPVSILAVAALWVGLLAIYALYKIYSDSSVLDKKNKLFGKEIPTYLFVSGLFLIFLILNIVLPHLFNSYISDRENTQFASYRNQQNIGNQIDAIVTALTNFRIAVFKADLWRSLIFILLSTAAIFFYKKGKLNKNILAGAIILLAVIDFWGISRRYVPLDRFSKPEAAIKKAKELTTTDKQIYQMEIKRNPETLQKVKELTASFHPKNKEEENRILTYAVNKYNHYRVFNLTNSPFNENVTSSSHNSIGGYHAAKLHRYQDMIEQHISKMNIQVLNMLDTKYIITNKGLQTNPGALGAAWFVDSVKWVDNANDEILALNNIDVSKTAVIRDKDKQYVNDFKKDSAGTIELTNYSPDDLTYTSTTSSNQLAVFSEVYFPYWNVYVDGKESKLFPVNYILRGMEIPAGKHTIEFKFEPNFLYRWNTISQIAYYFLILLVVFALAFDVYTHKKKGKEIV
jgi:hypothetical protein